jgi:hypothetical protein
MHSNMKTRSSVLTLAVCALALPSMLNAQSYEFGTHYPAGVEGIKAGSLPPPGFYLRDYNYFYYSDDFKDGPPDFKAFAYVQAPRLIWISDFKVLGANYGADILIPFAFTSMSYTGLKPSNCGCEPPVTQKISDSHFGLGDIQVEPITLSWHIPQADFAIGYAFWAPTGDFDLNRRIPYVNPGKGFWSHMFTAGGTYYFDKDKTWAVSLLNRYEIQMDQSDLDITPGDTDTLEWGISKSLTKNIELGLVGFYQQQTTHDQGYGADPALDYSVALGPEVSLFCSKLGLFTSLRYLREVAVNDRPEGNVVTLTLTKRW